MPIRPLRQLREQRTLPKRHAMLSYILTYYRVVLVSWQTLCQKNHALEVLTTHKLPPQADAKGLTATLTAFCFLIMILSMVLDTAVETGTSEL